MEEVLPLANKFQCKVVYHS